MKTLEEMDLSEVKEAYEQALRHQPMGTDRSIQANASATPGDCSVLVHAKAAYRRLKELEALAEGYEKVETGGHSPPVYARTA